MITGAIIGFVVLVVVLWIIGSPQFKGARGERWVRRLLQAQLDREAYPVFNDLTLPTRGGATQIDHVIVSRFGVFVVETKNMTGWIFGSADQAVWTGYLPQEIATPEPAAPELQTRQSCSRASAC